MTTKFIHIYKKGTKKTTFCLLHGTGGDENSLIPLAQTIDMQANIISLRGNVNENGLNRFFKRFGEGTFDEDDIKFQSKEIVSFLKHASKEYGFSLDNTIFMGYSNGANTAASIFFLHPNIVTKAILLRPMVPLVPPIKPDLSNHSVLIVAGKHDSLVPTENTKKLIELFTTYKADTKSIWLDIGHRLIEEDIIAVKPWYEATQT